MDNIDVNKLNMQSKDIVNDNVGKIFRLFPNCISEGKIDFDMLKQELSKDIIEEGKERYQLTWVGKRESIVNANTPTDKTLRPIKEKSVDFDNTKNIYIEGDNLEALKILQESYLNKIKCIYIDPPYNTGNDFVYNDNFSKDSNTELENSGQIDANNNKLVTNAKSNGRFHSDWLTMIYSRLKLARNLLKNDGVLFISIDDNEVTNMKKICDEIFGENNFLLQITNISNPRGRQTTRLPFALMHEYVLVYCRDMESVKLFGNDMNEDQLKEYKMKDELGKYRLLGLRKRGTASDRKDRPNLFYPIYYNEETKELTTEHRDNYKKILPKKEDLSDGVWRWQKSKVEQDKDLLFVKLVKRKSGEPDYDVFVKDYINKYGDEDRKAKFKSIMNEKKYNNERGTEVVKELFEGKKYFSFPKPVDTIKDLISFSCGDKDIVLDFFSGSATTAHAVMEINAEKNKKLQFIMIQLNEEIDKENDAFKDGYKTICKLGEERIRRAGKKIKEETNADIDYGFRVYKVDSSNMKDVYYAPTELQQSQLNMFESNVKEDRTAEDLLTQVILDLGLTLDLSIEKKKILNNNVYFVESNSLVACFDNTIDINTIDEICKCKPLRIVFKESSFKTDSDKINTFERIKKMSPETEVNII